MTKPRFVWHDLNTKDVPGAKRFYGELFNWKFEGSEHGDYQHIKAGDQMIGGVRPMEAKEQMPPSWLGYVGVDDVAATVATATQQGAKVYMPTMTMPNVGTFAVVADPTGGVFAPWKSARPGDDTEPKGMPGMHTFCWDELLTTDVDKASAFYTSVFGWTAEKVDMGPAGTYTLLKRTGVKDDKGVDKSAGGLMKSPPQVPYSFWMTYVSVPDCDATVDKAKRLGATIHMPATDIPNVGRFATMMDPQGASFAVLQPKM